MRIKTVVTDLAFLVERKHKVCKGEIFDAHLKEGITRTLEVDWGKKEFFSRKLKRLYNLRRLSDARPDNLSFFYQITEVEDAIIARVGDIASDVWWRG